MDTWQTRSVLVHDDHHLTNLQVSCIRGPRPLRVHVPNNSVLGIWGIVLIIQVLVKYMTIGYLDP